MVDVARPGDKCEFVGTLIVIPDVSKIATAGARIETSTRIKGGEGGQAEGVKGLKALGVRDLTYKLAFLACNIEFSNIDVDLNNMLDQDLTVEMIKQQMTEEEWTKIYEMSQDKNLYHNLITSLFPAVYGNEDVKKGILLMLFGGVPKKTLENTSLRGDLNVCIVGDPSTAKSQLLKAVEEFSPRAVYTSGKASTAAGLTAAVVRDEETGQFVIEAGALMLADNGVCCIDEFDKMDLKDQVAIHEAMEQQTISITKAGVKACLNAKTSILAAANPIGGKYDLTKSLMANISLSGPIMSRFDLFFILVDECNEIVDHAIACKIMALHANEKSEFKQVYTYDEIRRYILFARKFKPMISKEAGMCIVEKFKLLRQRDATGITKSAWRITIRQLESMIRISESLAKMYCLDMVEPAHVQEAYNLLNKSIIRVDHEDIEIDGYQENGSLPDSVKRGDNTITMDRLIQGTNNSSLTNGHNDINGHVQEDMETETESYSHLPAIKKSVKLTYNEYKAIANMILIYMRQQESLVEQSESAPTDTMTQEQSQSLPSYLKKSQIIQWYLDQISADIDSEAELIEKKILIEKILERLIDIDHVIIRINNYGLKGSESEEHLDDPYLIVHPNYVLDTD